MKMFKANHKKGFSIMLDLSGKTTKTHEKYLLVWIPGIIIYFRFGGKKWTF